MAWSIETTGTGADEAKAKENCFDLNSVQMKSVWIKSSHDHPTTPARGSLGVFSNDEIP